MLKEEELSELVIKSRSSVLVSHAPSITSSGGVALVSFAVHLFHGIFGTIFGVLFVF